MSRPIIGVVLLLALAVLQPGCRIQDRVERPDAVPRETLTRSDMIPAAWGKLVAVSSAAESPDVVELWFQDEQGNVRMVLMRLSTRELFHARVIRRN